MSSLQVTNIYFDENANNGILYNGSSGLNVKLGGNNIVTLNESYFVRTNNVPSLAFNQANAAFNQSNISFNQANAAFNQANAASSPANLTVQNTMTANTIIANTMNVGNLVLSGSLLSTSSLTFNDTTLTGNVFINGSVRSNIVVVPAVDIDCRLGNFFTKNVNTSSAFTFSNVPASRAYSCTLEVTHTTGTITWPGAVRWTLNTAPTLTTGRTHLFMFVTDDGGTIWRGAALVDYTN